MGTAVMTPAHVSKVFDPSREKIVVGQVFAKLEWPVEAVACQETLHRLLVDGQRDICDVELLNEGILGRLAIIVESVLGGDVAKLAAAVLLPQAELLPRHELYAKDLPVIPVQPRGQDVAVVFGVVTHALREIQRVARSSTILDQENPVAHLVRLELVQLLYGCEFR